MIEPTLPFGTYPNSPGYKRRETSKQAATEIAPKAETLRDMAMTVLRTQDISADDCAELLGVDKLALRPRFSELARKGLIRDTGRRTLNRSMKKAIVWGKAGRLTLRILILVSVFLSG